MALEREFALIYFRAIVLYWSYFTPFHADPLDKSMIHCKEKDFVFGYIGYPRRYNRIISYKDYSLTLVLIH